MVVVADAGMFRQRQPTRVRRGRVAVHRRPRGSPRRPMIWRPISIGTVSFSPTARSSTPSPPRSTRHRRQEQRPESEPNRLGSPPPIPSRGGRGVGVLDQTARCATPRHSTCRRTRPARSSPGTKAAAHQPEFMTNRDGSQRTRRGLVAAGAAPGRLNGATSPTSTPPPIMPGNRNHRQLPRPLASSGASFRMSKLRPRCQPMFARTRDAIEAHLTIVFTALALSREVQSRTGLSLRRFLRFKPLRSATIDLQRRHRHLPTRPGTPRSRSGCGKPALRQMTLLFGAGLPGSVVSPGGTRATPLGFADTLR